MSAHASLYFNFLLHIPLLKFDLSAGAEVLVRSILGRAAFTHTDSEIKELSLLLAELRDESATT